MFVGWFWLMFFSGLIIFFIYLDHLMLMLLMLEFIFLVLFFGLFLVYYNFDYEFYFMMVYLTFMVCESVLGLSLLVKMICLLGNDFFDLLGLLW